MIPEPTESDVLSAVGAGTSGARVAVLVYDDDVALATVIRIPGQELVRAFELQYVSGAGWREAPFGNRGDVVALGGNDAGRAGGMKAILWRGEQINIPVTSTGWWAFIRKLENVDPDSEAVVLE